MFEETWWPLVERRLAEIDYPLPVLMVQSYHPFGDNGSAYQPFPDFIDSWNEQGKLPRIVMATPKEWWAAVKDHSHLLPTYRGDWTDYWNFGCISSAREQALNRASRTRLRVADALAAAVVGRSDATAESTLARSLRGTEIPPGIPCTYGMNIPGARTVPFGQPAQKIRQSVAPQGQLRLHSQELEFAPSARCPGRIGPARTADETRRSARVQSVAVDSPGFRTRSARGRLTAGSA